MSGQQDGMDGGDDGVVAPRVPGVFALHKHPTSWTPPDWGVRVATRWAPHGLVCEYTLGVPAGRLVLPPRSTKPAARDLLWKRTCGEMFVGVSGEPGYIEFNFSPSGDWAAYAFDAYREAARPHLWQGPSPEVRAVPGDGATRLIAVVPHQAFRCLLREGRMPPLRAAFTLVLEADQGEISHWALAHPRPQPDFHDRAGFVADLTVAE